MFSGILLRLLAIFLLTGLSAVVHALGKTVPVGQIMFWRAVISLIPVLIYLQIRGHLPTLRTRHPGKHLVRGLVGGTAMSLNFASLSLLPVALASALGFLGPVLSLPLAALMLREKISGRVILAVATGFAGMLLMFAQAFEAPRPGQLTGILCGLAFAVCVAFNRIQIKAMTATESPGAIAFYFAVAAALFGLMLTPPWAWTALSPEAWGLLLLGGLIGGLGHIALTEATARTPVSALAAFEFTALIWASGFDYLLFDHVPGLLEAIGMITICLAAGLAMRQRPAKAA